MSGGGDVESDGTDAPSSTLFAAVKATNAERSLNVGVAEEMGTRWFALPGSPASFSTGDSLAGGTEKARCVSGGGSSS